MAILTRYWPILELAVLALLAPLALFPTPARFVALLIIPVLWLLRWRLTSHVSRLTPHASRFTPHVSRSTFHVSRFTPHLIPRTPLDVAILLLAFMVLVSLYATFDIAFSLPKIAGLVYGIAVFYATVGAAARSRRSLAWGLALYLAMGVGLAGLALLGTRWPAKFPALRPLLDRLPAAIRGWPGAETGFSGNAVAGALLWFIPLALAVCVMALSGPAPRSLRRPFGSAQDRPRRGLKPSAGTPTGAVGTPTGAVGTPTGAVGTPTGAAPRSPRRPRRGLLLASASGIALIVMAGTLILTQSRGGLVGLGVGLLGMLLWLGWWGRGVGLAAVAAATWGILRVGPARIGEILFGAVGTLDLSGRVELWSRAIYGIQDFPFTGMGLNTFRRVVHVLYPLFLVGPDTDIAHAHNHLLQVALDLGLPGLIAYLALWILVVFLLASAWRANPDRWLRACALGLLGGLLAHFVYGLTDAVALGAKPGVAFWVLLGLAVAVWRQKGEERDAMML